MKLDVYQKNGNKSTKKITLESTVFGVVPNEHSIYLAVNSEMAAIRQGTHSSKTRAEVSGSGGSFQLPPLFLFEFTKVQKRRVRVFHLHKLLHTQFL